MTKANVGGILVLLFWLLVSLSIPITALVSGHWLFAMFCALLYAMSFRAVWWALFLWAWAALKSRRGGIIVLARCGRQRQSFFGIRVEEHPRHQWVAEGAFAMDERSASRQREEGQAAAEGIAVGATYPGCPHCAARNFARCVCGRMSCWDGQSPTILCPWCQQRVPKGGPITSVSVWE